MANHTMRRLLSRLDAALSSSMDEAVVIKHYKGKYDQDIVEDVWFDTSENTLYFVIKNEMYKSEGSLDPSIQFYRSWHNFKEINHLKDYNISHGDTVIRLIKCYSFPFKPNSFGRIDKIYEIEEVDKNGNQFQHTRVTYAQIKNLFELIHEKYKPYCYNITGEPQVSLGESISYIGLLSKKLDGEAHKIVVESDLSYTVYHLSGHDNRWSTHDNRPKKLEYQKNVKGLIGSISQALLNELNLHKQFEEIMGPEISPP